MTVPASGAGEETAAAARELVTLCREAGLTLATAESLTAGLLAGTVADVPGASNVLRGGLVVYATDLKHSLAGVDDALLLTGLVQLQQRQVHRRRSTRQGSRAALRGRYRCRGDRRGRS